MYRSSSVQVDMAVLWLKSLRRPAFMMRAVFQDGNRQMADAIGKCANFAAYADKQTAFIRRSAATMAAYPGITGW